MSKNKILELVKEYAAEQLEPKEFVPGKTKVPASGASLSPRDVESLTESVLSMWYTEGKFCGKFRRNLSEYNKKYYATLCNSGSSANLLAVLAAVESFPNKEYIITCATNFPTSVAPIYQTGHIPIYIDIDPKTLSPDISQFHMAIDKFGDKIAGITLPHILGFPFNEIEFDEENPGFTIIDCCDALGAEIMAEGFSVPVGYYSDISTLSFFPAHHITTAEGGAVLTDHEYLKKVMDSFANWGKCCWCAPGQDNTCGKRFDWKWDKLPDGYDHKYSFCRPGYNLKMTEWQAALGVSQLEQVSTFVEKRKENYKYLRDNLIIFNNHIDFVSVPEWSKPSPFGFPIYAKGITQDLIEFLEERKIATRRVFAGNITKQPGFNLPNVIFGLPGCNDVMENMLWIGCHPGLTKEMLDYVAEAFDDYFREK